MLGLAEAMGVEPDEDMPDLILSMGNINTSVLATDAISDELEDFVSYRVDDADRIREGMIAKRKRQGRMKDAQWWAMEWNGYFSCLKFKTKIGTGLIQDIIMWCLDKGYSYKIADHTTGVKKPININWKAEKTLRPEQQDGMRELKDNDFRGLIHATMGYGKTVLGTHIIKELGVPTIILLDRTLAMKEWWEELLAVFDLQREEFKAGVKGSVFYYEGEPLILLCTSKLIHSANKKNTKSPRNKLIKWFVKEANLLIYDEVHRAGAKQKQQVVNMISAFHRVGLSGTVGTREDKADYEYFATISPPVYYYSTDEFIESGRGAQIYIEPVVMPYGDLSTYRKIDDFNQLLEEYIVSNRERNLEIARVVFDQIVEGRKILVLVDRVRHAEILQTMLGEDDVLISDGGDKDKLKKFDQFKSGEMPVMICTFSLAGEAFNYPELNTLVLAGGKSPNKIKQAVGRIVRAKEDGGSAIVFDIIDPINPFKDHFISRLEIYSENKSFIINRKAIPRWARMYL